MASDRIEFPGANGQQLAGRFERPDGQPHATVLFAHCFTCSKDIAAASRISRALRQRGFAVLRFDFTGLGNSDGDFENTDFSSNIQDLICAARWLSENHRAPELLVGHSLGGAAVLRAALELPEVRAVSTIGAPAEPSHVEKLLRDSKQVIQERGAAEVELGGRTFRIQRQFLDDLASHSKSDALRELKAAKLLFHSPLDNVVGIENASELFQSMLHPKSFVSLDQADHLLGNKQDSEFVADVLAAWAFRYVERAHSGAKSSASEQSSSDENEGLVRVEGPAGTFRTTVTAGSHTWQADEPTSVGGEDSGPSPYDLLLGALGACTSMTLHMYAKRKKLPLQRVRIELRHQRVHCNDTQDCEEGQKFLEQLHRDISVEGDLTAQQREKLQEIADKCPVHRTLERGPEVVTSIRDGGND